MNDPRYKALRNIAIVLTIAWVGWAFYDNYMQDRVPGQAEYDAAEKYFADGHYAEALREYDMVLAIDSSYISALRGKARTLMLLERYDESLELYNEIIAREPSFAASYANRGILNDRMGRYQAAIDDYEKAITLDPEVAEGAHWLIRFLRNQPETPPTIADRAQYLREQLAKPESERLLRVPEVDEQQRSYKM